MSSQKPLVLVVDDESQVSTIVRRSLELEGYKVLAAADGGAALLCFEESVPDLAIVDVMMPVWTDLSLPNGFASSPRCP